MEKIKIGYYVRFRTLSNEVKIRKIIKIDNNIYELDKNEVTTDKYIIGEPSESIVDLIYVGDYVNGEFVIQVSPEMGWVFTQPTYFDEHRGEERHYCYNSYEIKSIVTKEQFNNVRYEVE